MLIIQLQGADKRSLQFGKEMKRSAEEGDMTADRFTAGQTTDGLVDDCLENRSRKVLLGSPLVDQGLDIGFGENAAAGGNGIKCFVIFCIFIQAGSVCLKERSHLVNEGAGTSGTDAVHTLFDISAFKINDLRILSAELDGDICLWCIMLQGSGYGNNLLNKRNTQVFGQGQSAGTGDHGMDGQFPQGIMGFF